MNAETWNHHLTTLSADYGIAPAIPISEFGHLGMALNFFKELGIDEQGKRFLDVGCATGVIQDNILGVWHGIDIMECDRPNYLKGDVHELPYGDQLFDLVFCCHVLEHVIAPIIVLSEIKRVLNDNGDAVIALPIFPNFLSGDHNYVLPVGSWKHLFDRVGFEVVRESEARSCAMFHLRKKVNNVQQNQNPPE